MAKKDTNTKSNQKVNLTNNNASLTSYQKNMWKFFGYSPNTYQNVVDIKQHRTQPKPSTANSAANLNLDPLLAAFMASAGDTKTNGLSKADIVALMGDHINKMGYNKKWEDDEEEDDEEKENTRLGKKIKREKKFKSTGGINVNK